jgi:hypothetical protein
MQEQDIFEVAREYIADMVVEGFYTREEIIEYAGMLVEANHDTRDLSSFIQQTADELLDMHFKAQREWEFPTDCDRLDAAFAELDATGIVARHNYTCCQTCGHAEIHGEVEEERKSRSVIGYVFYHVQDTEGAHKSDGLYLAYGVAEGDEDDAQQIAHHVVKVLRRAGLDAQWNGDTGTRIFVPMQWKRRRSAC